MLFRSRVNRLEGEERPPLARGPAAPGRRRELKPPAEIEGQHTQALPRTVRRVLHRGYAREGEAALQFPVHLLVDAAAGHEGPERRPAERLVRHDRAVLVVPVARIEEIELEVLRGLVREIGRASCRERV